MAIAPLGALTGPLYQKSFDKSDKSTRHRSGSVPYTPQKEQFGVQSIMIGISQVRTNDDEEVYVDAMEEPTPSIFGSAGAPVWARHGSTWSGYMETALGTPLRSSEKASKTHNPASREEMGYVPQESRAWTSEPIILRAHSPPLLPPLSQIDYTYPRHFQPTSDLGPSAGVGAAPRTTSASAFSGRRLAKALHSPRSDKHSWALAKPRSSQETTRVAINEMPIPLKGLGRSNTSL